MRGTRLPQRASSEMSCPAWKIHSQSAFRSRYEPSPPLRGLVSEIQLDGAGLVLLSRHEFGTCLLLAIRVA